MKANAVPLLAVFEKKLRLEVPLFQRQYVWSEAQQWDPLWEDIERKFTEYLEGRKDAPVHFLGAMVMDQKQTPITHVEKRQVIDGQQRLTTLQIFLSAFRDLCRELECEDLAGECESFTLNKGMMADPEVDRFKIWPTQLDRPYFADVVSSGSAQAVLVKYPLIKRKFARNPEPRPRIVEAYLFFYKRLREYFLGENSSETIAVDTPVAERLEECFQALKNGLHVVVIDLDPGDDAQVIFETLNARGEPLLPADLLRNYIFLRAARLGESQEELYEQYWKQFDDAFWRQKVSQGRLNRPRSDLFMQHLLASRQTVDIPVTHLFVEYKHWIEKGQPFATVREELATIARQAAHFRRLIDPRKGDHLYPVAQFLTTFDVGTAYPLLLHLLDSDLSLDEWAASSVDLESYILRRSICGLTTKNLNRVFLALTRQLRRDGASSAGIREYLSGLTGDSTGWPTDDAFRAAWETQHMYNTLQNPKLVHVLRRLSDSYLKSTSEDISIHSPLTVEHLMPQNWYDNWPLSDQRRGMSWSEIAANPDDPRVDASRRRNSILQTIGNLTIVTQALNSTLSNAAWDTKKSTIVDSLLPINHRLRAEASWDEGRIQKRSAELFEVARQIWPHP